MRVSLPLVIFFVIIAAILLENTRNHCPAPWYSNAIGDAREVLSANQTYAQSNCGLYAEKLECMTTQDGTPICIPNYPLAAPEFIYPRLGRPSPYYAGRYQRHYESYDVPDEIPPECAPNSARFFCYALLPDLPLASFVVTPEGVYEDPNGGDVRCIVNDQQEWRPPPNALKLDSVALKWHYGFKRGLRWVANFLMVFAPTFLMLVVIGADTSPKELLRAVLYGVPIAVFAQVLAFQLVHALTRC